MSIKEPHHRLALARERAGFPTATDAARAFGWNENTYRSHENGERGIKAQVAQKYARAFKVSSAYILIDEKYADNVEGSILVVGDIVESGKIQMYGRGEENKSGLQVAFMPVYFLGLLSNKFEAFKIAKDNSYLNLSAGELVVVRTDVSDRNPDQFFGRLCIVQDQEDLWNIGYVHPGTDNGNILLISSLTTPGRLVSAKSKMPIMCKFYADHWGAASIDLWSPEKDSLEP